MVLKLIERENIMYNPAAQTTDSQGNPYSIYCNDELKSSGLGSIIKNATAISVEYSKTPIFAILNAKSNESKKLKFSLVVRELMKDFELSPNDTIEVGSSQGFRCARYNGVEYREKKNSIVIV